MLPLLLDILAAACLLIGGVVMALAALGVARLPDLFMRMHAATKAGVVGTGLILTGAGLASDSLIGFGLSSASVLFLLAVQRLTRVVNLGALGTHLAQGH